DRWLAISSASPSIAVRVFRVIGRPELADDPNYVDPVRRQERALEVDELVEQWVVERTLDEAIVAFREADVAAAPIYDPQPRATAVRALRELDWGRTVRAVRINGLDTIWCHDDIIEVVTGAREAVDVLIVPKARTARDVWWVDVLLTQLEAKLGLERRIALEVLIEDAEGLANAVDIARSSDRLEAVIFGAGDLSASQHARVDGNFDPVSEYPGDFWHF